MMTPRLFLPMLVLAGLALAGCQPASGGATGPHQSAQPPSDQRLSQVPLGSPPGQPMSLGSTIANPFEGDAEAVARGKALFGAMNCVYCHGAGGSGLIGPPLNAPGWRYGGTPAQIYNSIHDGRPQGMPAWGGVLPPDQVWQIVAYVESLGGAQPPATPGMAALGAPQPSGTGPEPADQVQTDTAHAALLAADRRSGG